MSELESGKPCTVDGCHRRIRKHGLCFGHLRGGQDAVVALRRPQLERDATGRKHCRTCDQWLTLDLFTKDRRAKDGLRSRCLACHSKRRRILRFGVSEEWFDDTLATQGGRCAICESPSPRGRGWAIDHDHSCCPEGSSSCGSCVRGILCNPCNLALGMFADRPDLLRAAITYLGSHSERMSIVRGV